MENNRDVTYKGADGKAIGFRTNDGLINGLIGHAGNRTIPAHLTHDWTDGKVDALHSRVGGVKNFRRDDTGALLADYHAMPGEAGDRILWLAENDPEHAMLSLVFDWNKIVSDGVTYAVPLNFEAADFVAKGAAVSAMLSQLNTDTDMTKEEIVALIKENSASKDDVTNAVKAALADYKPDVAIKAALSAITPEKATLSAEAKAELLTELEGSMVAKLGGGPLLLNLKKENDAQGNFTAKLAEYRKTSPNDATAIARLLRDHPELTPQREAHLQAEMAKLQSA